MPPTDVLLAGVTSTAERWWPVAVLWHVALGALLLALMGGWRPSRRTVGWLLALPMVSVAGLSWEAGNPFNTTVFALLGATVMWRSRRLQDAPVSLSPSPGRGVGLALLAFAWVYPHFLGSMSWHYLIAAPLGLVPCPTLSGVVGLLLLLDSLGSRTWSLTIGLTGVFYGIVGVFRFGVVIDVVLLLGALVLIATAAWHPGIHQMDDGRRVTA